MERNNINYYVTLKEGGEIKVDYPSSATVTIPIDILFKLASDLLETNVAQDYVDEKILTKIRSLID